MPIVDVELIVAPHETLRRSLAEDLANAVGEALRAAGGRTWVRLRTLSSSMYAEHGGTPESAQPVFVTILKSQRPAAGELADEITRVTRAVAAACGRQAENVHVLYEADARGRLAFGGQLVQ